MNQPNVDQLTEAQLWDVVCLATKECPCSPDSHQSSYLKASCKTCDKATKHSVLCELCLNKGPKPNRIWALPGMREPCWERGYAIERRPGVQDSDCPKCHGSGCVAKRDLGALLDYVFEIRFVGDSCSVRMSVGAPPYAASGTDRKAALLRAVAQALVAQGAKLGAT